MAVGLPAGDVEHQAFLLTEGGAGRGAVPGASSSSRACPTARWPSRLETSPGGDSTRARPRDDRRRRCSTPRGPRRGPCTNGIWRTGRCGPPTCWSADGRPVLVDFGFGQDSASPRMQAVDRAELLASFATIVGPEPAVTAARARCSVGPTRPPRCPSPSRWDSRPTTAGGVQDLLKHSRTTSRPRRRTVGACSNGSFGSARTLLDDHRPGRRLLCPSPATRQRRRQLRRAEVGELGMARRPPSSCPALTYVAAGAVHDGKRSGAVAVRAHGRGADGVVVREPDHAANVGGMALNVRFMQKAGVEPASAVTGVGLNYLHRRRRPHRAPRRVLRLGRT